VCPVASRATAAIASVRLTLGDLVRFHGDAYRRAHRLARVQTLVLRAIAACRTAALGGRRETCDHCGAERITYNSCRNRQCPACQSRASARWLEARQAELLPIPYFHVVFTLPHALNPLAQGNPRVLYTLLFQAAAETLLAFGHDPRYLGGTIGVTAILHTWSQTLTDHLHVHCLVTSGALSRDHTRWIRGRATFLFPVKALSVVFRAKYLAHLHRAFTAGQLTFAAGTAPLADAGRFTALLATLRATPWVVYAKRPFAGPERVLRYLGRYTHRIAISNARLVRCTDGVVQFHWKDYADRGRTKVMALSVEEFLRRFLLHVLPRGFVRIRHFGLLANRHRRATIARARHLLGQTAPTPSVADSPPADRDRTCPVCGQGQWQIVELLRPLVRAPGQGLWNTS
jgi:Zn finger protein HypA/HybF involved in hydrogenase expression